jgi:hypothetical protein
MFLTGKNTLGEKPNIRAEIINRFIPMVVADMYDLYQDGGLENTILGVPALFGVGTQTYGNKLATMGTTAGGNPKVEFENPPGLGEVIASKVGGEPLTQGLPNSQQLYEQYLQEKRLGAQKEDVKKQAVEGNIQPQGNFVPIQTEDGIKIIDISFQPKQPEMTGQEEIDKEAISRYKSEINKKVNDIYDLYKAGLISADEANSQIAKLKDLSSSLSSGKRKGTIKKVSLPTVKRAKAPTSMKIKTPKLSKIKKIKSKKYKFAKIKKPKIKVKMPKLPKFPNA